MASQRPDGHPRSRARLLHRIARRQHPHARKRRGEGNRVTPARHGEPERLRALLFHRNFAAYFGARQAWWLAVTVDEAAMGWQIFALHHNAFDLGLIGLIWFLPQFLLALPAGVLADRFERKRICIAVSLVSLACTLAYVVLASRHVLSTLPWFAVLAVQGVAYAVGAPAQRSMLAQIVQGTLFIRASALTSSFGQLVGIIGPALAGLLIAVDVPLAFGFACVMQAFCAIAYMLLQMPGQPIRSNAEPIVATALGGVRYVMNQKVVLGAISLDLFAVLFGGAVTLLPVFATQILHVGAVGFGILSAAPGVGATIVALVIARRPITRNGARWLFWCVAGFGVFTIVFGLSRAFWLSCAALALTGGCDMVSMSIRSVLVQLRTPDEMRGRVSAVENIFIGASNQLGAFESGSVAALIGAAPCVVFGGAATLAVIATWAVLFPALRGFDRLTDERL